MIFLCLFFGIPLVKDAKKDEIIFEDAPNIYIAPIVIWLMILVLIGFSAFYFLNNFLGYIIGGIAFGIYKGSKALKNKQNNYNDFLNSYSNYLKQ